MKAVLFPHTDPPPHWGPMLRGIFAEVFVYRPLGRAEEGGAAASFTWICPEGEETPRLEETVRALSSWAELHHGGAGLAAAREALRLSRARDEEPAAIAARLRGVPQTAQEPEKRALLTARALLLLAERADRERREAGRLLAQGEENLRRLVAALRGDGPPAEVNAAEDPEAETEEAIAARLFSWVRLFLSRPVEGAVFVTASRAALELLEERLPGAAVRHADGDPRNEAFASRLRGLLDEVFQGCLPLPASEAPSLSSAAAPRGPVRLLAWPGFRPSRLLARLLDSPLSPLPERGKASPERQMTVVLRLPLGSVVSPARRES